MKWSEETDQIRGDPGTEPFLWGKSSKHRRQIARHQLAQVRQLLDLLPLLRRGFVRSWRTLRRRLDAVLLWRGSHTSCHVIAGCLLLLLPWSDDIFEGFSFNFGKRREGLVDRSDRGVFWLSHEFWNWNSIAVSVVVNKEINKLGLRGSARESAPKKMVGKGNINRPTREKIGVYFFL